MRSHLADAAVGIAAALALGTLCALIGGWALHFVGEPAPSTARLEALPDRLVAIAPPAPVHAPGRAGPNRIG